jgi:hypothetical protein
VHDRGPLLNDKVRADSVASFLRSTGLYERVGVEGASVKSRAGPEAAALSPDTRQAAGTPAGKSLDELSSLIGGQPGD